MASPYVATRAGGQAQRPFVHVETKEEAGENELGRGGAVSDIKDMLVSNQICNNDKRHAPTHTNTLSHTHTHIDTKAEQSF